MASPITKAFHLLLLGFSGLILMVQNGNAFQFKVGGSNGWAVPSDPNSNAHNQWAESNRFSINDTLLFVYPGDKDSVLCVTKEDYDNCTTDKPIQKLTDGHTVFKLEHSGPYYFISGVRDNCLKNEKLVVVVLADRSKPAAAPPPPPSSNQTAPAPSPSNETTVSPPAASPSTEAPAPPSPAPTSSGESPSPPAGPAEINPTPAPSQESSPPNKSAASSILTGSIASLGAVAGSSLLLLF